MSRRLPTYICANFCVKAIFGLFRGIKKNAVGTVDYTFTFTRSLYCVILRVISQ